MWTFDTGDSRVLGIGRWYQGRKLIAFFNFSQEFVTVSNGDQGPFEELIYGGTFEDLSQVQLYPYGFAWFLHTEE